MTDNWGQRDAIANYEEACKLAADGHEGVRAWFMSAAEGDGGTAFHAGLSEADCPYREDYDGGDYWVSPAGLRQCWLRGWRYAWRAQMVAANGWRV